MKNNFWEKLNRPIYALAPMAGITDSAFRQICKKFGANVVYSEMASSDALVFNPDKTLKMLKFNKVEQPYIVQLFGNNPKHFADATKLIQAKIKPNGIDINFGCPVKKIVKQGAGVALMKNLKLSQEIIKSVINNTNLPVSIKCRASVGKINVLKFLDNLNGLDIKAVMIHGRSFKQGFTGLIDFKIIKKARNYFGGIILANGGINSYNDAIETLIKTKADGLGIARGALGSPWIFKALRTGQSIKRSHRAIFKIALQHSELAYKLKGAVGIVEMRKHLSWYIRGLPGARKLREQLINVKNLKDIREILKGVNL